MPGVWFGVSSYPTVMVAHSPDLLRIRRLESRMRGNLHVRFGGGRMEKDAAGFSQEHTNSGTRRTSPAAYPTENPVAGCDASCDCGCRSP
jgi:hypothetical protein